MGEEAETSQRGKSGVLASVRASVGAWNLSGEPGQREKAWKLWRDRFERATRWMAVTNDDKLDLLLLVGGEELQKLIETLPEQPTDYQSHLLKLDQHFKANRNNTLELYKWFNTGWTPNMYFADFETKCREQALHCDFPITLDNAIIMMTVVKTENTELRNEIIRKNGDLKSVRETAKAFEVANEGSQMIKRGEDGHSQAKDDPEVKRVSRPGRYSMRNKGTDRPADRSQAPDRPICTKCGNGAHDNRNACPATGRKCFKCGRSNHFARRCNNAAGNGGNEKHANALESEQEANTRYVSQEEELPEEVYLYQLKQGTSQNPTVAIAINGIPISLHIDTQADVTVVTEKHYEKLRTNSHLQPTRVAIRSYSGAGKGPALPLLGKFTATLSRGENEIAEPVYVVKGQGDTALLSRQAAERMGLVEYHLDLTTSTPQPIMGENRQTVVDLVEEYNDVFSGMGKLKGVKVKLHVDPDAKGAVQKQRRIAIPLKDKFDQILSKWEEMDIIEDVGDEPTDWCSNVVLTPKKDGENIRASLDMTDANKHIKRTRHAIPTLRELEARINGAKYFSHLDMNDGYMQLELAEESRKLTTFYTHRGLKRFKRLHFGVNSAAEIFNEEIRKVVAQEPNAVSIYDDILVYGATPEEHDKALRHVLQLWREHGLTLSVKKSRLNLRAVTFFGKVFTSEGISPDPDKVAALKAAGPPLSATEVRSFLFFAGANADFMEGFAQATAPLRELIKNDADFQWTPECQRSFSQVKAMLTDDIVMAYFDPRRKTRLKTDAGPGGMAVTLKQYDPQARRWRPVTYRSRAFTDTECRYSQLEKEAKAVEWGIFANQIYLYGLGDAFEVDTDHKPLVPLLSGYRTTAPLRVERMRVRLQGFNYRLNYVPGKKAGLENNEADYNSRHPEPLVVPKSHGNRNQAEFELRETEGVFEKDIMSIVQSSVPEAVAWRELLEETHADTELSGLKTAIARGYFTTQEKKVLGPQYDPVFTELAVVGGLVVRGARIVVPRALRDKVVRLAHEGHQGITKTKEYLRTRVWFPGLDRMVEAHIQHCHPCQVVTVSHEREPLRMTHMPSEPWREVAMDFWGPLHTGEYLLVTVCKQSRWAEVEFVTTTGARAVIPKLDKTFASLGIPVSVSSDNGPPFIGKDFSDFSKYLGFRHERKTPLNPQANAEAEQFMRILKKLYQISRLTGTNFKQEVYRCLRAYRATPHCTTKIAPADLMYPNRKFRTRLPIGVVPRDHDFEELYQRDLEKKMQMKGYADRKKYVKTSDIQIGDSVLVRKEARNKASSAYEHEPLQVQYRKGTRVVAKRPDGSVITRTTAHYKKVPFRSAEEAQRWSTGELPAGTVSETQTSREGEGTSPGSEKGDGYTTEEASESRGGQKASESIPDDADPQLSWQPPQLRDEGLRRSERHRKDTDVYLREKYTDFRM